MAPALPATPATTPRVGAKFDVPSNYDLEHLFNPGTIGAGDRFQTAIIVKGGPEETTKLKEGLQSGEYIVTQNGKPVPYAVIATPQYAPAFNHDPATTIYVESSVAPSRQRQITYEVKKVAEDGAPSETVAGDTFLTQPRAGFFQDPATGQVNIVVTGTQTPWGDAPAEFEMRPTQPPGGTSGTPGTKPTGPGGTEATPSGGGIGKVLTDAGLFVVTTGAGYLLGKLLDPPRSGDPAPPVGPVNQVVPDGAVTNNGYTCGTFVNDVRTNYTTTGYNNFPTGAQPDANNYAITEISGSSGIVATGPGESPAAPAFRVGDVVKVTVMSPTGGAPATPPSVQIQESGTTVFAPPPLSTSKIPGGFVITLQVSDFNFVDKTKLTMIATDGTKGSNAVIVRPIISAEPKLAATTTAQGGVVSIPVQVHLCGVGTSWVITPTTNSPSVSPVQPVVFGEGPGVVNIAFTGDVVGAAGVSFPIRETAGD